MKDETNNPQAELIVKQVLNAWKDQNKHVSTFFTKHDEASYLNEVAPGRNRAIYLLGHLIGANDGLQPLFGIGERSFPELVQIFSANPDKAIAKIPSLSELKQHWEKVTAILTRHFDTMTPSEWLERHTAVSEEDFAREPHRNKLNVLLSRTIHEGYHMGQLNLLSVKELVA